VAKNLHVWPAAGIAAVLSSDPQVSGLTLYRVDIPGLLVEYPGDYVVFGSEPPTVAVRGKTWSYRADVWTKQKRQPLFALAVPEGMRMTGTTLTWAVPPNFPQQDAEVRLKVTTTAGGFAEQKFRLVVTDPPDNH
jgi:hypothetical protein